MEKKFLVRIYVAQADKTNVEVSTLDEALKLLNKDKTSIKQEVKWSTYKDIFFHGTSNYIRQSLI